MSIEKRQRKGGISWYVRLRRPDGTQYARSFRTRKEAERFQAAELADRDRGAWIDPASGEITVGEWSREWFASNVHSWKPATVSRHDLALRTQWVPRLGAQKLVSVQPRHVQAIVNDLATSYANWTVRGYVGTGRLMFSDAVAMDVISRTPFRGIKLPSADAGERRTLTPIEVHLLADAIGKDWRCLIYVGGVLGLRFGEAVALAVGDIDLAGRRISITKAVSEVNGHLITGPPKTAAGVRTIDIPVQLAHELTEHIDRRNLGRPDQLIFADSLGGPIRRSNFRRRILVPALEATGIEGFTFHGLRHSAATQWVAAGIDLRTVQYWLGHSTPKLVLQLYAHAVRDEMRAAADRNGDSFWSV